MAAPPNGIEENMLPQEHKLVLKILAKHESMPFLELSSLSDIGDEKLSLILTDLEENGFVKITSRGNILDEIITVRHRLAALTASAA